ncbi:unnamed protein product, partial [Nesidiocoris tenuis]
KISVSKVMRQVDKNRDSFISYPELMHHMSKRFRPQHKERVAVAFNFFDKDSDGRLEFWETKQAVLYLGEHILAPEFRYKFDQIDTDQDGKITWAFAKIDRNNDGLLSWGETVAYLKKRHREIIVERAFEAFTSMDTDGDGRLLFWETKMALSKLNKDTTSPFLRHMFAAADRDKDQKIDFQEFVQLTKELTSSRVIKNN